MMIEVPLTRGFVALIDDVDAPEICRHKWLALDAKNGRVYAARFVTVGGSRKVIRMHRQLLSAEAGDEIDHVNLDTLDNRRSNLRVATRSQNMANKEMSPRNRSGFKGVWFRSSRRHWVAQIYRDRERFYLGGFDTPEEAARAYDTKARELFGPFARLNFPEVESSHAAA